MTLWSKDGRMIDRVCASDSRRNHAADYRALDVEDVREWFIATLARFADHPVEAIIPVAHGAAVIGLQGGQIAFPPLDYEQAIPDADTGRISQRPRAFASQVRLPYLMD